MDDDIRSDQIRALEVRYGRCVTVKGARSQMRLPGAMVGRFVDGFTRTPSARTLRRRRSRERRARGDVT